MTPPIPDPKAFWADLRTALAFLTRLPGGGGPPERLAGALRTGPLIGLLVGLLGALAYLAAARLGLPPTAAALIALAATIWATGALHEDGLADVADGFGGGRERSRKLAIMRDSRIGAFGVLALLVSLGLRAAALTALASPGPVALALIAAHALSRGSLPAVMVLLPPARTEGLAAAAGRPPSHGVVTAAVLASAIALLALGPGAGLVAILVSVSLAGLTAALARRQIGGYTGDVLGAVQQVAECGGLLAAAALLG